MLRIGLISDTHGLLREEALAALAGCAHIVHAGDVGDPAILRRLEGVAPLTAVRGNVDREAWAARLPETELVQVGPLTIYVIHDLAQLDIDPSGAGVGLVVSGHSHKPVIERRKGVLYVNPGSAGPRRFRLPVSIAEVAVDGSSITPRVIELA